MHGGETEGKSGEKEEWNKEGMVGGGSESYRGGKEDLQRLEADLGSPSWGSFHAAPGGQLPSPQCLSVRAEE